MATPRVSADVPASCCGPLAGPRMSVGEAETAAVLLKALADPQRVRIVNHLANSPGPVCVCDLTGPLGLAQPTVSHHLKKLRDAGLVRREQRGTWAYYGLDEAGMRRLAALVGLEGGTA